MKQLTSIVLALFLGLSGLFAQKSDAKNVTMRYTNIPAKPLAGPFKTYQVSIQDEGLNLARYGLSQREIQGYFSSFTQFRFVESKGDFKLVIRLQGNNRVESKVESYTEKTGSGDNVKEVTKYKYLIKYRVPLFAEIYDGVGTLMRETSIRPYNTIAEITRNGYASSAAANNALRANREKELTNTIRQTVRNDLSQYSKHLQNRIDKHEVARNQSFFTIKKAEKFKLEGFDQQFELVKSQLKDQLWTSDKMGALIPAMQYWGEQAGAYKATDKKGREVVYAAAYNQAVVYLLNQEFEQAREMISLLETTGIRKPATRYLGSWLKDLETRLQTNANIPQTYSAYVEGGAAALPATSYVPNGFVMLNNGEKMEGKITCKFDADDMLDEVVVAKTSKDQTAVPAFQIKEMEMDGTRFDVLIYSPGNYFLAEYISGNDKASLFTVWDAGGRADLDHIVILLDPVVIIRPYLELNINKAIRQKFGGQCPLVAENAAKKMYSRKMDDLKRLVNDMAGCQ
ncbi:MAG: hypothetical protein AAFR61_30590 [Bacteroidota bacterium]